MKSFAIWCNKYDKKLPANLDIHINLWKAPLNQIKRYLWEKNEYEFFLDLGFQIYDIHNISDFKIYFPFRVEKQQLVDLGQKFAENTNLIISVFNEDYAIELGKEPKQIFVKGSDKNFIIYNLDIYNGDCELEEKYKGSVVTIKVADNLRETNSNVYYRLRICSPGIKEIVHVHKAISSFFESALTKTEVIDFRLNEKRIYNRSMLELVNKEGEFIISKLHFLMLTNSEDEIVTLGENPTCRQLEDNLWNDYVEKKYNIKNIFAYHWKKKEITSHNSLIKIKVRKSNFKKIISYIFVIGLLSIVFNILTDLLKILYEFLIMRY